MIKLQINFGNNGTRDCFIPEQWDELNQAQLELICTAQMTMQDGIQRKVEIARGLCGLDPKLFNKMSAEVVYENILPLISWVEDHIHFSKQLIPCIKVGDKLLHGPESGLRNIRLAEWDYAEQALLDWFDREDKLQQISRLMAILYRPAKGNYDMVLNPEGDVRVPFNDNLIKHYTDLIANTVPVSTLFAILFWYRGCRNIITEQFKTVFSDDKKKGPTGSESGYYDLMRAIANQGTYGDFEKVEKMYLGNALQELKCVKEEAEALKLSYKK